MSASTTFDYDYIVVGSGFGGSVSALRLSEKGHRVLVIEKGSWYGAKDFPKTNWNLRKWLWMPRLRMFGIMKMTIFRHITVLSGTGVGGGSLVYANTLPRPQKPFFNSGSWADLKDWQSALDPHYVMALKMLGAVRNPKLYDADRALEQLADEVKRPEHFRSPMVSVFFGVGADADGKGGEKASPGREVDDPYFGGEGPSRTGCIHCGACMTGCPNNAKNTLDKNYLHLAQLRGAQILAETEAIDVLPLDAEDGSEGYRISTLATRRRFGLGRRQSFTSRGVVFSGGVLGTLSLLLKLKPRSLPRLSDRLGDDIRTNNETLISVSSLDDGLDMSKGLAIGSLLRTDDDSHLEVVRYSKGSGFWRLLHLPVSHGRTFTARLLGMARALASDPLGYARIYTRSWSRHTAVLLFMQTLDSTLQFRRSRFPFLSGLVSGGLASSIASGAAPSPNIPSSNALAAHYARITGGKSTSFALETLSGIPSTAHILGGAVMAADPSRGVIDASNRVFGYRNMLIVDGSAISANPGVNPSLTITAIAEHAMAQLPLAAAAGQ